MVQQAADEIRDQLAAQRPTRPEVTEDPGQVRHAREHHAAIGDRLAEIQRPAVDRKRDIAHDVHVETSGGDDDVGLQRLARLQEDALLGEPVDVIGDDRSLPGGDPVEQISVGDEGDALAPGAVGGREMLVDVIVGAKQFAHLTQHLLLHQFRLLEALISEGGLIEQYLAPRDFVNPRLVDLELAQGFGDIDGIAPAAEIGRRPLQHGHMGRGLRHRRNDRRRGRAGADNEDILAGIVQVFRPVLGVCDHALEVAHALPIGRIALMLTVIALAHPKEVAGKANRFVRLQTYRLDGPEAVLVGPVGVQDLVAVTDVLRQAVLFDHLAHVGKDFRRCRDRRADPGFETVTEGVQVAVRADAGKTVGPPRAAEVLFRL